MFKKVTIVGVGLIGGSLGMALCKRRLASTVVGVGRNSDTLQLALEYGAVHQITSNLAEGVADADLVVLATHVKAAPAILEEISANLTPGTVVTDVGSTKTEIVSRASKVMPEGSFFVGGHPMAGSELQGVAAADPYLFENAFYLLTPVPNTPEQAKVRVRTMAEGVGARVIEMSPEEHDLAVAAVSHLPHVVAVSLVNSFSDMPKWADFLPLAAGGFRDTTRIAMSNPQMWRDIFLSNRNMILDTLQNFKNQLSLLEKAIFSEDSELIMNLLEKARELRLCLPVKTKGYLPTFFEILVTAPDQPGAIAGISIQLAQEGINIIDIEILRVREDEGGTIRLAFATEEEQEKAVDILGRSGIMVRKK